MHQAAADFLNLARANKQIFLAWDDLAAFDYGEWLAMNEGESLNEFDITPHAAMYDKYTRSFTSGHICAVQLPQSCWYNFAAGYYARISRFATSDPFGPQCGDRIANYMIELLADT